ncbi:hypothetical protein ACFQY0_16665 [Haloferula chungangensis]|uniref:Uncharacterized protein n=1 Tax=Haloferula chungangensis TaxID=1048331 RepID=A0ABW2LBF7_9BACT
MKGETFRIYPAVATLLVLLALFLLWENKSKTGSDDAEELVRESGSRFQTDTPEAGIRNGEPPLGQKRVLLRPSDEERKVNSPASRKSQLEEELEELKKAGLGGRHPNVRQIEEEIRKIVEEGD